MERVPQAIALCVVLKAYLSSDHVSAATGKTLAVVISKNIAAFGNPSAGVTNATEISNGWYYADLSTTDTGTVGPLIVRATSSGVDDVERIFTVVDAHNAGFDGVPSATAGAASGLPLSVDSSGRVDVLKVNGTSQTARDLGAQLDAAVSSRSTYAGADTAGTTTLLTRIPGIVQPQTGDSFARLGAPAGASIAADLAEIEVETDAIGVAGAGLTALGDARLANLDAAVSSRTKPADTQARVTLVDTLTTYTGDTPQTGDSFARLGAPAGASIAADLAEIEAETDSIGVAGAGLTALGDARIANLDAAVSSRTKPADTQARVTLVDTLTTYTGDVPQTGDSYARLGAPVGASVSADIAILPTALQNSDTLLRRDFSAVTGEAARSLLNAARILRNKVVIAGGVITVYKEDNVSIAFTETISTDSTAIPIVGVTP